MLTRFPITDVSRCRPNKARKRGFERIVGSKNINIYHGFEGVGAELVDRSKKVACRTRSGTILAPYTHK